jgi:hypothetical protein
MTIPRACVVLLSAATLAALLSGCGKQAEETPAPATQADAVKARLNDPNVSEYEKSQIRSHMNTEGQNAPSNTTNASPDTPAGGGQQPTPASGAAGPGAGSGGGK